ncbi:hypothetical protein GB928_002850 [Shinella curvata]|uniref:Uncharacterized protein n=1 Tax=Shinella curvata TaxID=1817964 RepID=A0ABT8X8Q5_9HYPH|nr:hypothetical protein [Shinella curvata]MCJ8051933.1 hypothetical protein [Shinella curvata]MDO6120119.1 hypothetical protein [Shinella curvata]
MSYIVELVVVTTGFLAALAALLKEINSWRTSRRDQEITNKTDGKRHDFL